MVLRAIALALLSALPAEPECRCSTADARHSRRVRSAQLRVSRVRAVRAQTWRLSRAVARADARRVPQRPQSAGRGRKRGRRPPHGVRAAAARAGGIPKARESGARTASGPRAPRVARGIAREGGRGSASDRRPEAQDLHAVNRWRRSEGPRAHTSAASLEEALRALLI